MTPKEKAKELVEKYLNTIIHFPYIDTEDGNCIGAGYMTHNSAKQCALIAVDETVNMFISIHSKLVEIDMLNGDVKETATYQYWQEVKQEINLL